MADQDVVETLYSENSKYEIIKHSTFFGVEFYLHKNGKSYKTFSTLQGAVEAATEEGAK